MSTASSSTMPPAPTIPSSSPATEYTKSVLFLGTNPPWVWVPWNRPLPKIPPEPIATRACAVL